MKIRTNTSPRAFVPAVAFLILAAGIVGGGWFQLRQQLRQVEARAESELFVIGEMKVKQIMAWRAERLKDARDIAANPFLARELEKNGPSSTASLAQAVKPWLYSLAGFHEYTDVAILDGQGTVLVTLQDSDFEHHPNVKALLAALGSNIPVLDDFSVSQGNERLHLDLYASVQRDGRPGGRPVGAVIYRVDPNYQLFPLLQSWPIPSPSAEVMLVRRDGDNALVLNELRHLQPAPLSLRIPLSSSRNPAAQGALGYEGIFRGIDHRGAPILASVFQVPGTPWTLVAKVDTDEILSPVRQSAQVTAMAVATLLIAALLGVTLWRRQEHSAFLAHQYRRELEQQKLLSRTKAELVTSEERLRLTLNSIADAMIATDHEGRIERMNPVAERLTGWPLEEARGRPLEEIFRTVDTESHPPQGDPAVRVLRDSVAMDSNSHVLVSRDDGQLPIAGSGAPIRNPSNGVEGAVIVFRDATEERAARVTAAFQTRLLETLHDSVIGLDNDLRVRSWNSAAEQLYGWTAREAVGRTTLELFRTEYPDGEAGRKALLKKLNEVGRAHLEHPQIRRDGTTILAEMDLAALRGTDGQQAGYLMVTRDVSERRRTEAALRTSEAKFRAAFQEANLGILLVDPSGRMLEYNRAFREMLGYSEEEMLHCRIDDLAHPEDLARALVELQEMSQGKREEVVDERRFLRKGGVLVQGLLRASAIRDSDGRLLYAVGVIEDVTQRRRMEGQLIFADRMSAVGTLAAGVAHELNNPLAFVIANLAFAHEALQGEKPSLTEIRRAIREAHEGAERARNIVRDLRLFARPDKEDGHEVVDVREPLRSSISLAQNEIRHRAQLVEDLREVPAVAANAHRLGQVFLNLLINATRAIPEGHALHHEIRVATRMSEDGRVLIEFSDTGSGIPAENLPRIFEPFFTTSQPGEGVGLGLSICHGIISALGGEIQVRSTVGRGSTFRVLLPPTLKRSLETSTSCRGDVPQLNGRILVVDDEPMIGRAIHRILSPPHEVTYLTSAEAALLQLEQDDGFDLVLCDLMMPDMTGMELHHRLTQSAPKMSDRMVFLSGGAFTQQASEFLEQISNLRIEKPFDPHQLRLLVGEVLARARA